MFGEDKTNELKKKILIFVYRVTIIVDITLATANSLATLHVTKQLYLNKSQ